MLQDIERLLQQTDGDSYHIHARKRIFTGSIFSVDSFDLETPDGTLVPYEVVNHHGGAGVCALRGTKLCVVRQYRPQVGRMSLEIPAGRVNEGEDELTTARRELQEETGYIASNLTFVARSLGSLGWTDEATAIYFCDTLIAGEQNLDEGELVDVYWLEVKDLLEAVQGGHIQDNKTIISIFFAAAHLGIF